MTKRLNKDLKKKILKSIIWSTALYGCETWTLKKMEIKRLKALETWLWRRLEKISYNERITNEQVLERIGETRLMIEVIMTRTKKYIGHNMHWKYIRM